MEANHGFTHIFPTYPSAVSIFLSLYAYMYMYMYIICICMYTYSIHTYSQRLPRALPSESRATARFVSSTLRIPAPGTEEGSDLLIVFRVFVKGPV